MLEQAAACPGAHVTVQLYKSPYPEQLAGAGAGGGISGGTAGCVVWAVADISVKRLATDAATKLIFIWISFLVRTGRMEFIVQTPKVKKKRR
jgi:hypothetical protein